ncbi:hypothetical protein G9A89_020506 [Geosiphon pyriformis]|nr:hypothetical protein G9A89_020506 [Geosiphon pyriformis]
MKGEWQERSNRWMKYPGVEDAMVDAEFYEEFLKTKRVILFQLMNRIKSAKTNRITAVGHGIGGVHAIFALLEIREIRKNLELMVVTYGQPHIGNREFANYINSLVIDMPVVRITLFDDFVPRMPFTTYRNYYVHHLHELWIGPPKCDCPSDKEDVYWCVGSEIRQENGDLEINESLDCNLKYSEFRSNSHNGPYFNVYMGNCLQSSPPWVH